MARPRLTYLSDDDRAFVHEQAVRVLEDIGIGYNTPEAIELLAEAGAHVDAEALTAKLPWELVERCLATCPSQVRLAARDPRHDVVVGDGSLTFCADGTATYMLDDLTGRREEGSAEWLRRTMRLYDALPEVDYAWPTISARDLDPLTAGLEIEAISLANLTKHVQDEVRDPAHAAPLVEIFEAVAGGSLWDRPIFSTIDCTVAPLQHEREMTEATMAMVRAGVPVLVLPMPLSGTTAPMTVLGTMIVNVAELLSAVVLFQLAQPGCGIISGMGAGVADMRSGLYLCGTPECALMNVIGIEMSRFYGLPCTGSAITCDAKASNQQAGAEGMLTGEACALAGADTILAFGCSDGAQSLSFAKVLLDCDSVGALRRLVRDDPIDATRALIDDIAAVGIGGHYLGRKSTRRFHHAGEVWQPGLWQRGPFEQYEGRPLVEEAAARADELLRTHEVKPLADDVVAGDRRGDRALRTQRGRAGRARELEGRDPSDAVVIEPLDDLAAMRRLGVACGLEDERPRRRRHPRGLGRPRRRPARRLSRARALRGLGHAQLARRGRELPAPRSRCGAVCRAGARSAGARRAPAVGDRAGAGVLPGAGVRAGAARRRERRAAGRLSRLPAVRAGLRTPRR